MAKKRKQKTYKIKSKAARKFLFALKVTLLVLLVTILVGGGIFYFVYGRQLLAMQKEAKNLVAQSTVDTFRQTETSVVYDSKKKVITELKGEKDVYYLDSNNIPDYAKKAIVSIEDKKFYSHGGVDLKAISRAMWQYIKHNGHISQGGSTITQQLSKNIFLSQERTWERKIKEMFISLELEKKYTKEQILEFYLNNVYFSNGHYGIQSASNGYFNKNVDKLSLSEIAFLCAIPNAPTRYDPLKNYDNTIGRRDRILKQMLDDGYIDSQTYNEAIKEKIKLNLKKVKKQDYVETYVRHCAVKALMKNQGFEFKTEFKNAKAKEEYEAAYDELYSQCQQSLYQNGYRIYTSISMSKQKKLQKTVNTVLKNFTEKTEEGIYKLQGASVCIDNKTGRVVAIVGGRKQKNTAGYTLNRAFQSYRQPGSSIKPLVVYTPSLERNYTPDSIVDDHQFEGGPRNSDGRYSGKITLRSAVAASKNTVAWQLFEELTPKEGLSYLLKMGFSNIVDTDYYLSSSLGGLTHGVTPVEMASGFCAIENEGTFREPTCIRKITDSDGNVIVRDRVDGKQVYGKNASRMMTSCMETVMESGTGRRLKLSNMSCAGKTGTTNDKKDGWFVGFTPYYTTSVWVGYDSPRTVYDLYGNTYPGQIWNLFMSEIHQNLENMPLSDTVIGETSNNDKKEDKKTAEPKETNEPTVTDEPDITDEPKITNEPKVTEPPEEWYEETEPPQKPTNPPKATEPPKVTEPPEPPADEPQEPLEEDE